MQYSTLNKFEALDIGTKKKDIQAIRFYVSHILMDFSTYLEFGQKTIPSKYCPSLASDSPVCAPKQQTVYGGSGREPVNITCKVISHPPPTSFKWSLNTSSEDVVDVPRSRAYHWGKTSMLAYTPRTPLDYGALLCRAENSVGWQQQPCVYQVGKVFNKASLLCSYCAIDSSSSFKLLRGS